MKQIQALSWTLCMLLGYQPGVTGNYDTTLLKRFALAYKCKANDLTPTMKVASLTGEYMRVRLLKMIFALHLH